MAYARRTFALLVTRFAIAGMNTLARRPLFFSLVAALREMPTYRWISARQVERILPELREHGVSEVARSRRGFLTAYVRHRTPARMHSVLAPGEDVTWARKRELFIRRTLAAYNARPTYRRWLALMAWAYRPARAPP